jgi:hypothetical protein
VHQTGDLANLDGLPEEERQRLPSLIKLRKALGSLEFRRLIADITSCGPLSGTQIDLSVNIHAHTGHLLCHDDVIGTRKVRCVVRCTSATLVAALVLADCITHVHYMIAPVELSVSSLMQLAKILFIHTSTHLT